MNTSHSAALALAEEVPVALVFNGITHAVMMASPTDLEDFALGFALTEGLLQTPSQLFGVDTEVLAQGIEVRLEVAAQAEQALKERRRSMAGRTGCGLCGADSLGQVRLALPQAPEVMVATQAMFKAHAMLRSKQPEKLRTGATHAAAWANLQGDIVLVREDVGRHNALDKLIGALLKAKHDMASGFVCITSRASFEMVQKTVKAGAGVLTAVSAPTSLAVELAQDHNLVLAAMVRGEQFTAYSHGHRLLSTPQHSVTEEVHHGH
jgi:FdhD protein